MALVSFGDQFPIHRKVDGLSDAAFRLHTAAIFWCFRNRTDGIIPAEDLDLVCPRLRGAERLAAECVRRECWHDARNACGSADCPAPADVDGWAVHDYLEYHPISDVSKLAPVWQGVYPLNGDMTPDRGAPVAYLLFDAVGKQCYAGSTNSFPDRLTQHFRSGKEFVRWAAYPCRDREAAYRLERSLCDNYQPYLNKRGVG